MKRHLLMTTFGALLLNVCGTVRAQAPVPGQPYQVPAGYESYSAGTQINYGGYDYVIQGDATMLLAGQPADVATADVTTADVATTDVAGAGQVYQVPDGYAGAAGSVINYGGADYVLQDNGTMMLSASAGGYVPASTQVYQIPSAFSGYPSGSVINYGGADYTIGSNGTMVLVVNSSRYNSNYGRNGAGLPGTGRGPWNSGQTTRRPNFPGPGQATRRPNFPGRGPWNPGQISRRPNFPGPGQATRRPNFPGRGPYNPGQISRRPNFPGRGPYNPGQISRRPNFAGPRTGPGVGYAHNTGGMSRPSMSAGRSGGGARPMAGRHR